MWLYTVIILSSKNEKMLVEDSERCVFHDEPSSLPTELAGNLRHHPRTSAAANTPV